MKKSGSAWECQCGKVEYGKFPPEECPECEELGSFVEVSAERKEELESELLEKMKGQEHEDDDDFEEEEVI